MGGFWHYSRPPHPPLVSRIKISAVPYLLKCIEVCESMLYHICKDNLLQVHHLEQQILYSSLKNRTNQLFFSFQPPSSPLAGKTYGG